MMIKIINCKSKLLKLFIIAAMIAGFYDNAVWAQSSEGKSDFILVQVKKVKNSYVTLLYNVPNNKMVSVLKGCKEKFGSSGAVSKEQDKDVVVLQGDQKFNIEKYKDDIFKGYQIKMSNSY